MRKSIDNVNQVASAEPSADDVFEAIHTVMHLYRAGQYRDGPHGLSHMEGKVLGFFAHHPGATQKDLADHSGRDKGQLARLIGSLKERKLLDATTDEADRRSVRLQLTAEGRGALKTLQRQARRLSDVAVADISAPQRLQLVSLLLKIRANLEGPR